MAIWDSMARDLNELAEGLKRAVSAEERLSLLDENPAVKNYFASLPVSELSEEEELTLKAFIATGQAERVAPEGIKELLKRLIPVEAFYRPIGGIVGYHTATLMLLKNRTPQRGEGWTLRVPPSIDISHADDLAVRTAIVGGIVHLGEMAEIYPVGGAADRLGLNVPAAKLQFCGKTLLEHLIADMQAREYLHYKLLGKQLTTPLAMMTSEEKNNHEQILAICEENRWFGRPKDSFRFFSQPLVPALNKEGRWCLQEDAQLLMKPGGHGVIWKLAHEAGIFSWFAELGRRKGLVRQINNIIAGIDYGLLAFTGIGCLEDKHFGFAGCPRFAKTSEGINVLMEKEDSSCLTNIEYCDLERFGIRDEPDRSTGYSPFPCNTNLLFFDFQAIEQAIRTNPFPGMLINAKKMRYKNWAGELEEEELLRLESTMQNIADYFTPDTTYLTHHVRHKTISPIKRAWAEGSSLAETPESCFLDLLKNARELLAGMCAFSLPQNFVFLAHPALGPLFSIIAQKIQRGAFSEGSELILEIADLYLRDLDLQGCLIIRTEGVMGHKKAGILRYSEQTGKCRLTRVSVRKRCEIFIEEGGEFEGEDLILEGDLQIHVPRNTKMRVTQKEGQLFFESRPLQQPSWSWQYAISSDQRINVQ